ncbi:MAG: DUF1080 domain-containing protein [Prolixibacteraceae bacterium]|jgi:hypothetical protein|nr:DUF1080 domain-containing protein [Prolixibacteraceae bacterium]
MNGKFFLFILLILPGFSMAKPKEIKLFNGKDLSNWEIYLSPSGAKPSEPLFDIVQLNGESLLRISGEVNASLASKKEYENYHLRMVFRWGDKVFKQRNSGILYHSFGPFGDGLGVWMSAHEFQLCTAKMGDSYCMGNSYFEIPALKDAEGKNYHYAPGGVISKFGANLPAKNCSKLEDHEKPVGEWNVVDLYCVGRKSMHLVNGKVNMVNSNSGRIEKDGSILPLSRGKIQIQSEGGELYIRSITLEKISKFPYELE